MGSLLNWSCSKLDTTDLGSDILPAVDNVNTFADTLNVITSLGVFNPDTTELIRTDNFVFGKNDDPLFGKTTANIYFQLKPAFFPYYFGNPGDTLTGSGAGLDSVVLCLSYKGFYGDSTIPLHVEVREVADNNFRDDVYHKRDVNYKPSVGQILASKDIDVRRLGDTVHYSNGKNFAVNQIRIKLSPSAWADFLYSCDTINASLLIDAFRSDSAYRHTFHGLAVTVTPGGSGNTLIYTNLADLNSKLEVHFRRKNKGVVDSIYNSFQFNSDKFGNTANFSSGFANYVLRNRLPLPSGSQELYLQTNPGTYANLSIPGLSTLSNRIIHRAELIIQQIPEIPNSVFKSPTFLYLDLQDSGSTTKWKPIYHDLNPNTTYDPDNLTPFTIPFFPNQSVGLDFTYFGGYKKDKTDLSGNTASYYNFNISRYVQDIVTLHKNNYNLRLYSPTKVIYPQYSPLYFAYGNSLAYGRVKVGGGNNTSNRMILRVIYSKL